MSPRTSRDSRHSARSAFHKPAIVAGVTSYHESAPRPAEEVDVALIGGGIMSATLAALLTLLEPTWRIGIYERRDEVAQESSDPWNSAGTGHAALCELNYTPGRKDGSVDISKAVKSNGQFHTSR